MKKYLPLEQQFELMDAQLDRIIEELDLLLVTAGVAEDTTDPQEPN